MFIQLFYLNYSFLAAQQQMSCYPVRGSGAGSHCTTTENTSDNHIINKKVLRCIFLHVGASCRMLQFTVCHRVPSICTVSEILFVSHVCKYDNMINSGKRTALLNCVPHIFLQFICSASRHGSAESNSGILNIFFN